MEKFKIKITVSNQADGVSICQFIDNLDHHHKLVLLLGGLCLPFDIVTNTLIKRFIARGGDFLIKVGTDVRRVKTLAGHNFPPKPNARAKNAQKPNDRASFHEL